MNETINGLEVLRSMRASMIAQMNLGIPFDDVVIRISKAENDAVLEEVKGLSFCKENAIATCKVEVGF